MPTIANKDMHDDFVRYCNLQKDYYLSEIHNAYNLVFEYYDFIKDHVSLLSTKGIKLYNPRAYFTKVNIAGVWDLPKELHAKILAYNYTGYEKIDDLIEHYEFYNLLSNISRSVYNSAQRCINHINVNNIVRGETYVLGAEDNGYLSTSLLDGKSGYIRIEALRTAKEFISKAETFNTIRELKKSGEDATNIRINVEIGSTYNKWKWRKLHAADFAKQYMFKPNRTQQSVGSLTHLTEDEIYASTAISGIIKMFLLIIKDSNHGLKYKR